MNGDIVVVTVPYMLQTASYWTLAVLLFSFYFHLLLSYMTNITKDTIGDHAAERSTRIHLGGPPPTIECQRDGDGAADTLDHMRYARYMLKVSCGPVLPEKLPPTARAAFHHCLCAHLQAVCWIMLDTAALNPTDCG